MLSQKWLSGSRRDSTLKNCSDKVTLNFNRIGIARVASCRETESVDVTLVRNDRKTNRVDKIEDFDDMALSAELLAFMQNMQVSVDKISADIIASKADLKKDINEGRREVKEELFAMNKKINAINDQVEKNKIDDDLRMNRMERRMEAFDKEKRNLDLQIRKRKEISTGLIVDDDTSEEAVKTKEVTDKTQRFHEKEAISDSYSDKVRQW